jgi:hypothetical protein
MSFVIIFLIHKNQMWKKKKNESLVWWCTHVSNPSTQESEAGTSPWPAWATQSDSLSKKTQKNKANVKILFFWWHWSLNSGLNSHLQSRHSTAWATLPIHFALVILEMGVYQNYLLGWPWTMILQVSPSQVIKIIGVSYQRSVWGHF